MNKYIDFFHSLFVPKSENNFKAKALHIDFLTYYLIIAIVLSITFKNIGGNLSNVLGFATDITVDKLLILTNEKRVGDNIPALSYNQQLATAAKDKAQDMFARNYWSHYGPNGTSPWDFILGAGYKYEYAGENLAKNFLFSQGVVDAWMNSPTHRDNILRKDYTEVGFAIVNGVLNGEETTLVVQMFGKPQNMLANNLSINQSVSPITLITPTVSITQNSKNTIKSNPIILSNENNQPGTGTSQISYNINIIFIIFLILALIMDLYFATKFNIIKMNGKNLAHLIFVGFIFLGLLLITKGAII